MTGSVSTRTTYLVIGNILEDGRKVETGNKYKKASELGTTIMNESALEEFFKKVTKNPDFNLLRAKAILEGRVSDQNRDEEEKRPALPPVPSNVLDPDAPMLWADKYAPRSVSEIVGNAATIQKIKEWLHDWEEVVIEGHKKPVVFRPGMSRDNIINLNARACLLSGSPGIGKSTAAALCAREGGFTVIETNASDNRNKKIIEQLLTDAVGNESITQYSSKSDRERLKFGRKTVVVMDEVDGVSGNSDRGGIQALIKIIKNTQTPIICICNDRMSPKVRSLAGHCYDLKFVKYFPACDIHDRPQNVSIRNRLKVILEAEKVKFDDNALDLLIESSGNDVRQMINSLQLQCVTRKTMTFLEAKDQYWCAI
ncbi:MAG: AAA family ATPase [Candidatus Pacebacteria bacterium]|nr:AAA family ATPase [Candidatus Paceibacterota bacterium]